MNINDQAEQYLKRYMSLADSSALGDLYALLAPGVYSFIMGMMKNEEEAKDIVQDTFMIVAEKANQYRFGTSVRNWIFEIARNLAFARLKKSQNTVALDEIDPGSRLGSYEQPGLDTSTWDLARKILTPVEYQILSLYIIGEYKHREIADILKIPLGTVTWKYKQALGKLRKELTKGEKEHE